MGAHAELRQVDEGSRRRGAPLAYEDVGRVVDVVQRARLARRVARLRPLGVVRG